MLNPRQRAENTRNVLILAAVWISFVAWFVWVPSLPHPAFLWLLTAFYCLALQQYFSGVIHEAAHGVFYQGNRRLNEFLGNWFASYFFLYSVDMFRMEHFQHHGFETFFVPEDRETAPRAGPRSATVKGIVRDLFFVSALEMLLIRNLPAHAGPKTSGGQGFRGRLPILAHFFLIWGSLAWFGSPVFVCAFFASIMTLYPLSNRLRAWGTHGDLYKPEGMIGSKVSRNVMSPVWERIFVGNRMMMYHYEHHLEPHLSFRDCERRARDRYREEPPDRAPDLLRPYNTHAPSYVFFARHYLLRTFH